MSNWKFTLLGDISRADSAQEETHFERESDGGTCGVGHARIPPQYRSLTEFYPSTHCPEPPENMPGLGTLGLHWDDGVYSKDDSESCAVTTLIVSESVPMGVCQVI